MAKKSAFGVIDWISGVQLAINTNNKQCNKAETELQNASIKNNQTITEIYQIIRDNHSKHVNGWPFDKQKCIGKKGKCILIH